MKADECFGAGENTTIRFEVYHFRFAQITKLTHVIARVSRGKVAKNLVVDLSSKRKRFAKRLCQALKRVSARCVKRHHFIAPLGF